jgi:endonuclease/exonuclease/phosphatase family metal-dependent hydrolase
MPAPGRRRTTNNKVLSSNAGLSNPIQDISSSETFGTLSTNAELNPIILVGDFNENLDINTSETAKLCEEHELVDTFAARHPDTEECSTYIRGTKRIDYYLVSRDIIPAVTAVGYKPYHYRTTSDHQGLFLDLDVGPLYGNATTTLAAQPF